MGSPEYPGALRVFDGSGDGWPDLAVVASDGMVVWYAGDAVGADTGDTATPSDTGAVPIDTDPGSDTDAGTDPDTDTDPVASTGSDDRTDGCGCRSGGYPSLAAVLATLLAGGARRRRRSPGRCPAPARL